MTTDSAEEVARCLDVLANAVAWHADRLHVDCPDPTDVADRLERISALQQTAAANASRYSQGSSEAPSASGIGALLFAGAAARLGLAGAVLGEALEAAAHLHHTAAADLSPSTLTALRSGVDQGLAAVGTALTGLSVDLLAAAEAVAAGPPWPPVPRPAAVIVLAATRTASSRSGPARFPGLPPAAGEHEARTDAARRRAPNLAVVAEPPTASATPTTSTVLPFRRT